MAARQGLRHRIRTPSGPSARLHLFAAGSKGFGMSETESAEAPIGGAPLALDQTELFFGMRPDVLQKIADRMTGGAYAPGILVASEGTPGDCLFVIGQGSVEIIKGLGTPEEKKLSTVKAGGFFGEMSLIENRDRSASVRTLEPCIIYALKPEDLQGVAREEPHECRVILVNIARGLSARLRAMDEVFAARSF